MRLYDIRGKLIYKNCDKYLIDWDAPSKSKVQFRAKQFFRQYWSKHVVFEEFKVFGRRLYIDLLNATTRLACEINGSQHSQFNPFFHQNSRVNFWKSLKRDFCKAEWLEKNNFQLLEIEENEVDNLSLKWIKEKFGVSII